MLKQRTSVIIIDKHLIARSAICNILSLNDWIQIIDVCNEDEEAIDTVEKMNPDIVLLNIDLNMDYAIEIIHKILKAKPAMKIIAMSMINSIAEIRKLMAFGIKGFVLYTSDIHEFRKAILEAEKGHLYIPPGIEMAGSQAYFQNRYV